MWGFSCWPLRCPVRRGRKGLGAPASEASAPPSEAQGGAAPAEEQPQHAAAAGAAPAEEEERMCRYCFDGAEAGELISPCRCAGGQKYVHLTCLRAWQRTLLVSQPTHPDLYDTDTRQRVCNVCKAEFTCPPPTRAELLANFTGPELAALIEEGCLIASAEDFSWELEQQVVSFPEPMRDSIIYRNWVRGAFLIVKVIEERGRDVVDLRISGDEELQRFLEHLGDDVRTFHLRGRRFSVLPQGPLRDLPQVIDAASAADWRAAARQLRPPLTVRLRPLPAADRGEDGIVAVNLTRPFDLHRGRQAADPQRRAAFAEALGGLDLAADELRSEVKHFIAGPCEEEAPAACLLLTAGGYRVFREPNCLAQGLRAAEAIARGDGREASRAMRHMVPVEDWLPSFARSASGSVEDVVQRQPTDTSEEACAADEDARPLARGAAWKRRRLTDESTVESSGSSGVTEAAGSSAVAEAAPGPAAGDAAAAGGGGAAGERARLLVFWGYAGWSRCQLMGEIARGSWGMCRSEPGDVLEEDYPGAWRRAYHRLIFAPKSEMSESYGGHVPREQERRRELRRLAIFHDLLRGRAPRVVGRFLRGEDGGMERGSEDEDEDPAQDAAEEAAGSEGSGSSSEAAEEDAESDELGEPLLAGRRDEE